QTRSKREWHSDVSSSDLKAKIILNNHFPKELLNQYNINENAIIVNILENMKINKKRFNGTIINDYEISYKTEKEYNINEINIFRSEERRVEKENTINISR